MTVAPGNRTDAAPRRMSPLVLAIPIIAIAVVAIIVLNNRNTSPTGVPPIARLQTADVHTLAFSSSDANSLFLGHHDGLMVSRDQGTTWQPAQLQGVDAMSLATSAGNPQRMYAAGHGIFYRSDDGGANWTRVESSIQGADIHAFAASPDDADRVYAFVENQGISASGDGGATWQPLPPTAPTALAALAAGPGQTLYVGTSLGDIFESADGGRNWRRGSIGTGMQLTSLIFDQGSGDLYATATMAGSARSMLHRRLAGRDVWDILPFSGRGPLVSMSISPQDSKVILTANQRGEVYRSRDGGATWGTN